MKALGTIGAVVAVLVTLHFSLNYLAARVIAERLPAAISEAEDRPVSMVNVSANLWRLRAYADQLTYGDDDRPYLRLKNLYVELNARDLLRGRINIESAGSTQAVFHPKRWTQSESEDQADFGDVERWIPRVIRIDEVELVEEGEVYHAATDLNWYITSEVARRMEWLEQRGGKKLRFQLTTTDQSKILRETGADLDFRVTADDDPQAQPIIAGKLRSEPGNSGMSTVIEAESLAFRGTWTFQTSRLFELPTQSNLKIEKFEPDELTEMAPLFAANPEAAVVDDRPPLQADFLKSKLPVFDLPDHTLNLSMVEMTGLDNEKIRDIKATLVLQQATDSEPFQLSVPDYSAELPRGDLTGKLEIATGEQWQVAFDAEVVTRSRSPERLKLFKGTNWMWESGDATVTGKGATLAEIIDSLRGQADVTGVYKGKQELPVELKASLSDRKGRIGADVVEFTVGGSSLKGTVWMEENRQELYVRLHTGSFDVTQLIRAPQTDQSSTDAGWKIPDIAWWESKMQVDARLTGDEIVLPGGTLSAVDVNLKRATTGEILHLSFSSNRVGSLHAQAQTARQGNNRHLDMNVHLEDIATDVLEANLDGNLSGQLRLQGQGASFPELVASLQTRVLGTLAFNQTKGSLTLSGKPTPIVKDATILGLRFENLQLKVNDKPLTSGRLAYDVRDPVITGELKSAELDLDALLKVVPAGRSTDGEPAAETTVVSVLNNLPTMNMQLNVDKLVGFGEALDDFAVNVKNGEQEIRLQDLSFKSRFGQLDASSHLLNWQTDAEFELDGKIGGLVVSSVVENPNLQSISAPLSGAIKIATSGSDWQALTGNLRGEVKLQTAADTSPDDVIKINLAVKQAGSGIEARLEELTIGRSDLSGTGSFVPGDVPVIRVSATSNHLDLVTLEEEFGWTLETGPMLENHSPEAADSVAVKADDQGVTDQTQSAFTVLRDLLGSPLRLFSGGADPDSERFFSDQTLPLELLSGLDADVDLTLHKVVQRDNLIDAAHAGGSLKDGLLDVRLNATQVTGGSFQSEIRFELSGDSPRVTLITSAKDFRSIDDPKMSPNSMFVHLTGTGASEAALVGSLDGQAYLSGGKGVSEFGNFGLGIFSTDLLSQAAGLLVPNRSRQPEVNCTVAYAKIDDGVLVTPKAAVIQTPQANILFRAEVDLKKERVSAQFDSRSRTGAGVSVGNVFSNTVRIRGSLKDPGLVPNTTGIIWRGWAALATGGLSLLGESFVKRVLSSPNACRNVREDIQKLVCGGDTPAAKEPLVCPVDPVVTS